MLHETTVNERQINPLAVKGAVCEAALHQTLGNVQKLARYNIWGRQPYMDITRGGQS